MISVEGHLYRSVETRHRSKGGLVLGRRHFSSMATGPADWAMSPPGVRPQLEGDTCRASFVVGTARPGVPAKLCGIVMRNPDSMPARATHTRFAGMAVPPALHCALPSWLLSSEPHQQLRHTYCGRVRDGGTRR